MRILLFCCCWLVGLAAAAPPTDASLRELIAVTESQKLVESSMAQLDSVMQASMANALRGKEVTPEMRQTMDEMRRKVVTVLREEMSWEKLEPMFISIYQDTLTQSEVDGMLAFYKSEAGRAMVAKMPLIMNRSMEAMQERMQVIVPRLDRIQRDTIASLEAQAVE